MTNPAIQNDFSYYRRTLNRMRLAGGVSSHGMVPLWHSARGNTCITTEWLHHDDPYFSYVRGCDCLTEAVSNKTLNDYAMTVAFPLLTSIVYIQELISKYWYQLHYAFTRHVMFFIISGWHRQSFRSQRWCGQQNVLVLCTRDSHAESSKRYHHKVCLWGRTDRHNILMWLGCNNVKVLNYVLSTLQCTVVPLLKHTLAKWHLSNKGNIFCHQILWMPVILPLTKGHLCNEDRIIWRKGCPY